MMAERKRKQPNPLVLYLVVGLLNWLLFAAVIAAARLPAYAFILAGVVTLGMAGLWYWIVKAGAAGKPLGVRLAIVVIASALGILAMVALPLLWR